MFIICTTIRKLDIRTFHINLNTLNLIQYLKKNIEKWEPNVNVQKYNKILSLTFKSRQIKPTKNKIPNKKVMSYLKPTIMTSMNWSKNNLTAILILWILKSYCKQQREVKEKIVVVLLKMQSNYRKVSPKIVNTSSLKSKRLLKYQKKFTR